jgi:hypothetical protein
MNSKARRRQAASRLSAAAKRVDVITGGEAFAGELADGIPAMETALGFGLTDWQRDLVLSESPRIVCCAVRQSGKSIAVAVRAALRMRHIPNTSICILSPTARQSGLLHAKIRMLLEGDLVVDTATRLSLGNGSTVVALPGDRPASIRGATGDLIIDEAAFIKESLIEAALPISAARGGHIMAISTPNGKGNWFHQTYEAEDEGWDRYYVTLENCGHYDADALSVLRARLGERRWRQEMQAEFLSPAGALFDPIALEETLGAFTQFNEPERTNDILGGFKTWED